MKSLGPGYLCRKFWNFQLDQLSSPIIGLPTLVITNYHTIYLLMRTCTETCTQTQGGTGTELSNVCYYAILQVVVVGTYGQYGWSHTTVAHHNTQVLALYTWTPHRHHWSITIDTMVIHATSFIRKIGRF